MKRGKGRTMLGKKRDFFMKMTPYRKIRWEVKVTPRTEIRRECTGLI